MIRKIHKKYSVHYSLEVSAVIEILAAFMIIMVTHIPGLLKSELKTIIVFGLIWSAGLSVAILVAMGIFLPVIQPFNLIYYFIMEWVGFH